MYRQDGSRAMGLLGAVTLLLAPVAAVAAGNGAAMHKSRGGSTYYVDSSGGSDSADGESPRTAWRSLARINNTCFAAGDKLLLRRGSKWHGRLWPRGSGAKAAPVLVGAYGTGARPAIHCDGKELEAVKLHNQEYWEITDLEITNTGKQRRPERAGVRVTLEDFGTGHHIQLRGLYIHDVNGSLVKKAGGGRGIHWRCGGQKTKSRFDGLLIEKCHLARCDRNGIGGGGNWARKDWHPSLNVVIRGNLLEDIGGDGIVVVACDGALIEHNTVHGARRRAKDHAAGIWPWSCDNTLIQFNEVSHCKGTKDGQGFDSDWNCRNSLFQYNYSHDNDGGFMLICNNGTSKWPLNIGNTGTVIRYNISQNDKTRLFHISGPCRDIKIYNNTFYVGKGVKVPAFRYGNWGGGWPRNTLVANNIFYVDGQVRYEFGGSKGNVFKNNVFFGRHVERPNDANAITADPKLISPGGGANGRKSLTGYKLGPGSRCLRAGEPMADNGGRDFWGNALPPGPPDVGAHQLSR